MEWNWISLLTGVIAGIFSIFISGMAIAKALKKIIAKNLCENIISANLKDCEVKSAMYKGPAAYEKCKELDKCIKQMDEDIEQMDESLKKIDAEVLKFDKRYEKQNEMLVTMCKKLDKITSVLDQHTKTLGKFESEISDTKRIALRGDLNYQIDNFPQDVNTIYNLIDQYKSMKGNSYMLSKIENWEKFHGFKKPVETMKVKKSKKSE